MVISGAAGVQVTRCDFTENGSGVVPGPRLQHNLLLTRSADIRVEDSRLDTSPYGSGISIDQCMDVRILRNEIARNAYYGVLVAESRRIEIGGNLIENNDRSGIMVEFQYRGWQNISAMNNRIQFNNGHGLESYAATAIKISKNKYVKNAMENERIKADRYILMK